jgi:hypothetical protein
MTIMIREDARDISETRINPVFPFTPSENFDKCYQPGELKLWKAEIID